MTVSQVGTPALASGTSSVTGSWGTGQTRTAGDLLVAVVTGYGSTSVIWGQTPSGWAQVENTWNFGAGTQLIGVFTKVAAGSDAAPVFTQTLSGSGELTVTLFELADSSGGTPQVVTGGDNFGTSGTITVTTTGNVPSAGCFAISGAITSQGTTSATTTWTTPSGWSLAADQTGSAVAQSAVYYLSGPSSGSTLACLFTHGRTSTLQVAASIVVQPPAAGGTAVAATASGSGVFEGMGLAVKVVTGAASSPAGTAAAASVAANVSVTPGATGSWVYGAVLNDASDTSFTAESGTTIDLNGTDSYNLTQYGAFRTTSTTTGGTPVTVGATNALSAGGVAALEVVASGTLAESGTAPAAAITAGATALQTVAFVPPAGSLLVAMVTASGTASNTVAMSLSDSRGLTWTQQSYTAAAGDGYAGVWTAQVPGSPSGVAATATASAPAGSVTAGAAVAGAVATATATAAAGSVATGAAVTGTVATATATAAAGSVTAGAAVAGAVATAAAAAPAGSVSAPAGVSGAVATATATAAAGSVFAGAHSLLAEDGSSLLAEDGSFLLDESAGAGVTVTGVTATATATAAAGSVTGAAPAVFPAAPLDLRCEIGAGGWTDTSSDVYQRTGDSPPVTLTRGRADESSQANPGSATWEWNNRSGKYSPKNPLSPLYGLLGRNTPVRWSVPAQHNYLRLEADTASDASCPDASGLHITGDLDLRADLRLTDWQPHQIAIRWATPGNQSWFFRLNADGTVQFFWSTTGTDFPSAASTVPLAPSGRMTLRVTLAVSSGTVTFYTGPPGNADSSSGWTQLGAAVVTGATSVYAGTAGIAAGGFYGSVYELELRSGIGGTVKAHPLFSSQSAGTTSFTDAQSNTWTLNGTAEISDRSYRWHGQMSAQPPAWDVTGRDMAVKAQAGGPLRLIGQGQAPLQSPMKRAIVSQSGTLAPVAYWPCEDAAGATFIGSALGGPPMTWSGTPSLAADTSFLGSSALPTLGGAPFRAQVPAYTSNGSIVVRFLAKVGTLPSTNDVLMRLSTTGGCQTVSMRVYSGGSGGLGLAGYDSTGTSLFDTGGVSWTGGVTGVPLWYSIELRPSGTTLDWQLTTLAPGATSALDTSGSVASTAVGHVTGIWVNPDAFFTDTALGHVSVQSDWVSLFSLASALNAWQGETAATRFARLAGENGYAARIIGAPSASAVMGAQAVDTLGNLLQACEDADRGQIFEPRQALALGYRTLASMYSQSPKLTLDYSASEPGGVSGSPDDSGLDPTYDDLLSRNDWTLTRSAGTGPDGATFQYQLDDGSAMSISEPPAGIGDYSDTKSVNVQYDAQLPNLAGWMVHAGTVDEARWPVIPVNLARSEMAALYYDALDTDIGDYAQITNAPDLVVYGPVDQLAFQVTEQLGGFHYAMEFNAVPELPYEVAFAGTARADTAGSQLHTSYSSSATSFSVDVTAGNLWITTSGFPSMFPFDVNVAGERITVTAITGSSSPQAFTVTRAVNGVSKAQASGAPVSLWNTPVAAL